MRVCHAEWNPWTDKLLLACLVGKKARRETGTSDSSSQGKSQKSAGPKKDLTVICFSRAICACMQPHALTPAPATSVDICKALYGPSSHQSSSSGSRWHFAAAKFASLSVATLQASHSLVWCTQMLCAELLDVGQHRCTQTLQHT